MNMQRLITTLTRHEGEVKHSGRHFPYMDTVGKTTIGIGRNLTDKGISDDEARFMLTNDVNETLNDLRSKFYWFEQLDDIRQEVVANMAFNMGIAGFSTFKNTIADIEHGNYESASQRMLRSKWAGQVGNRAKELSEMMRTGHES